MDEAVAQDRAAVAARADPNMLIVARTDVVDEKEAIDRAARLCGGGRRPHPADLQVLQGDRRPARAARANAACRSRCSCSAGSNATCRRKEIEEVAGIATYPLVPLMTAAAALQENLKVLAKSRSTKALPRPVMAHDPFVEFIGFPQIDELQRKFLRTPQAAE